MLPCPGCLGLLLEFRDDLVLRGAERLQVDILVGGGLGVLEDTSDASSDLSECRERDRGFTTVPDLNLVVLQIESQEADREALQRRYEWTDFND